VRGAYVTQPPTPHNHFTTNGSTRLEPVQRALVSLRHSMRLPTFALPVPAEGVDELWAISMAPAEKPAKLKLHKGDVNHWPSTGTPSQGRPHPARTCSERKAPTSIVSSRTHSQLRPNLNTIWVERARLKYGKALQERSF
jgi:hypothetical protein